MIGTYERIAQRLLRGQPKARPFGKLINGHFYTGTLSLHRTKQSRLWRLFWKLKSIKTLTTTFDNV